MESLREEGGITRWSLENAKALIKAFGYPDTVLLTSRLGGEHIVCADWSLVNFTHVFDGFSWGYGGEGPRGLCDFFGMLKMVEPITMEQIASWPQENMPAKGFSLNEDYGRA